MARKSLHQSRWLLQASKAASFAALLIAGPALADEAPRIDGQIVTMDSALIASVAPAQAPAFAPAQTVQLILAVEVNGMDHGLVQFRLIDDQLWATRSVLEGLGLKIDHATTDNESELLELGKALGSGVTYNAAMQSLAIMVEASRLNVGTSRLNINAQDMPVAQSATGALLNYDVYANYAGKGLAVDGFGELRAFSGNVLLESTGLFNSGNQGQRSSNAVRLDTTLSWSIPDRRLTLRAGDILTRSTSWSRPTRLGGLRIGTDFALQPYLVTAPIPSFFGEATLPSTIDLYIDGMRRYSGSVAPGPFELGSGANVINGAGNAQIVVTDALGQVTALEFPIYDTPLLLRNGLTDWSIELGAVRENFGISSLDYASNPVVSASLRSGLTNQLTLEAHGEAGPSLLNAGGGLAWLMPFGGVVAGSVATSASKGHIGRRVEFGYSWTGSNFNLAATMQRASSDYADLPSINGAPVAITRDVVNIGYGSDRFGYFGASLIRQRNTGEALQSFVSLNWQKSIGDRFAISFSANQDLEDSNSRSAFITLSFNPGDHDHVAASFQASDRRTSGSLGYRHSLPDEGGTGWAIDTSYDGNRFQAAGQLDHLGSNGQFTAGARLNGGRTSAYAGYSGALVAMGGDVFVSRKVFDGFAVVDTDGVADLPVRLHNREIGHTNANGKLLVTGLNAFQNNAVSIDPTSLAATLTIAQVDQNAVPAQRAGVLLKFAIEPISSILVSLVDEQGTELPVGTRAIMEGAADQPLMVGFGGQLFIERALASAAVQVSTQDGSCFFQLPQQIPTDGAGLLGRMVCEARQ